MRGILCAGIILLVAALLAATAAFCADDDAAAYNKAGALYREGRFGESLSIYEDILGRGIRNPDLLYNAGCAAFRTDDLGKAVLYLERARALAPSDEDILANLSYLNSIKQDQEPESGNTLLVFFSRQYRAITPNGAALWSGIAFALLMGTLTFALFLAGWRRIAVLAGAGIFGIIFLAATITLAEKVNHERTVVEAVVMADEAPAYSGPDTDNVHIFTLHEGTVVIVERTQDDWVLVRLRSGAAGWLRNDLIERI